MAEAITCIAGIDCSNAPAHLTKDELALVLGLDEAEARRIYESNYKTPKPDLAWLRIGDGGRARMSRQKQVQGQRE